MTVEYKCIDVYKKPENPMEWLPCPRCGLRPLVWEFDNGRSTACGCGTDCYSHWSVQAESIMSVINRSDNGHSAKEYDIDELKNNWNHWVRTGEILFTPGNQTRYGLTQLWFIPLIERIQNACCKHHNDVNMSWEDFVKKMSE